MSGTSGGASAKKMATSVVPATTVTSVAGWNRRLLVVDDEVDILGAYQRLLAPPQKQGGIQSSRSAATNVVPLFQPQMTDFEVVVAPDFDSALQAVRDALAEGRPFTLGFFDVRLGENRDGVELAKEIRKLDPRMGAVFVTAYNDRSLDSIESVLGTSVSDQWDYLNKPFNGNEILQKARNFTALWNLRREREEQAQTLADLNRLVLESERVTSVAAVARGVSHEFGNLLMQIIGKAEISRNKSETEMREALDRIIDASQRASEILDRFNHLSDNKSAGTKKMKVSLAAVLKEALDLVGHQLRRQGVTVELNVDALESRAINAHGTSLLQVFINLSINAMHAMEDAKGDRKIHIEGRCVNEAGSDRMVVSFRDTGPGAPAELLERLTEPFFTTKGAKGTGLGLAICRELIEIDHGGEFKVGNHPDGGFEIRLSLPVQEGTHDASKPAV